MERRCSSGSIGERLTPVIRMDAGASKSDLRLHSARLPFSTPASMIVGIVFVDDHSFLRRLPRHAFARVNGLFKFLPFRMHLFQKHTLHHKSQSHFTVLFLCLFSDIVIWPSRGPVYFRLIVLVSLRFCTSFPPFSHHNSVRIPPFRCSSWSRRYGHMSPHICFYPDARCFDVFTTIIDRVFCLPLLLKPIIVRYRQHGHYLRCPKWAGRDFRSRVKLSR